jgi:hypothetical protein
MIEFMVVDADLKVPLLPELLVLIVARPVAVNPW